MQSILNIFTCIVTSLLLTTSCATLTEDIVIKTRANTGIDYSHYKTYTWADNTQITFDPIGQWEQPTLDTDEEVRFIVNRELRNLGINQVEKNPDIVVSFTAGVKTTSTGIQQGLNTPALSPTPKAALVIALVDNKTGDTVWLGLAEGKAQPQQSMENIHKRINYAVHEIFKNYNK